MLKELFFTTEDMKKKKIKYRYLNEMKCFIFN